MSLGLFGGVFDPPHSGHVALVATAKAALRLDRVIVVVVADPGHKQVSGANLMERRPANAGGD